MHLRRISLVTVWCGESKINCSNRTEDVRPSGTHCSHKHLLLGLTRSLLPTPSCYPWFSFLEITPRPLSLARGSIGRGEKVTLEKISGEKDLQIFNNLSAPTPHLHSDTMKDASEEMEGENLVSQSPGCPGLERLRKREGEKMNH